MDYEGADGDEEEDEDEDENVNEPGSTGPVSGKIVGQRRLGFTGGRKTRKRKQKRLLRRS